MRIDFSSKEKQKQFFRFAKRTGTWKELHERAVEMMHNPPKFRVFEAWVYGRYLPPCEVVKNIYGLISGSKDLTELNIKLVSDHWGSVKGGKNKIRLHGTNLTRADRVKGGKSVPKDPERLRRISHLGFLKSTRRKFLGPNGELVFNKLEKEVAESLHKNGISYEYEPIMLLGKWFVVPDFRLKGKVVVECTGWTNIEEKSFQLRNKIKKLLASKTVKRAIVVTNQELFEGYWKNLNELATVTTVERLTQVLNENK